MNVAAPSVSVVICVRNGAGVIQRQLDALLGQVDAPPFEILIIDNGSTDATAVICERVLREAPASITGRVVVADSKAHIPRTRNVGLDAAQAPIVAFCDADDAVHATWVRCAADFTPSRGILGGPIIAYGPDGARRPDADSSGQQTTRYLPFVPCCNLSARRDFLQEVGGFDESLPSYGFEDADLSWRAQEAGGVLQLHPGFSIDFTVSGKLRSVRKEFLAARAKMAAVARHPGLDPDLSLRRVLTTAGARSATLPLRMLRPGATPRSRHLRWFIDAWGNLSGYVDYQIRRKPPALWTPR